MKSIYSGALAALAMSFASIATAQTPPASPHTFSGNATLASDYRFRGVSQTFLRPAFQGGFNYAHESGFYLGNWNSNVSGLSYPNGASLEVDLSVGYKKTFGDFGFDVGYLTYNYPGSRFVGTNGTRKFDNRELYLGGTWKWLTAKVFYATSNYFGLDGVMAQGFFADRNTGAALPNRGRSRGTMYYDLTAAYEFAPKWTLNAHVGRTDVKNYNELDYTDYLIGVTYDWNNWLFSGAIVGTDADKSWYYVRDGAGTTKSTGKTGLVLSIGKNF